MPGGLQIVRTILSVKEIANLTSLNRFTSTTNGLKKRKKERKKERKRMNERTKARKIIYLASRCSFSFSCYILIVGREITRSTSTVSSHGYSGDQSVLSEHDQVSEGSFEELSEQHKTTSYTERQEEVRTLLSVETVTNFRNGHDVNDCQPLQGQVTTSAGQCQEEAQSPLSEGKRTIKICIDT